ncbi:hypothetical protein C1701_26145 [Actinoalloteichus sp. AHMU CJ021]|uniref:Uncharacterized protein n=1 Tax=Actinoalloteichus caeruleus DSM 43889 TaxID=1120930 RepID=A0ABT1JMM2_ACTCY|nr:hypothetical protein [Actinoalloteichus caeruleus]AUS81231.1 hypothetical protein C1701_26145 [Actinoalloteichus sp. AHMU CJ021]MCP2333768.1 hypothetical protein [Actinoalloteichus caeruleus DSM 43889]
MSGSYEVDPEALPRAIAELKEALDCVLDLQTVATRMGMDKPSRGDDAVSLNAGDQFRELAASPQSGSLGRTAMQLRDELMQTIHHFESMLAEYLNLEDTATLPQYEGDITSFKNSPTYQEIAAAANRARAAAGGYIPI